MTERDMAGSTVFFPVAGALQGLITALTALGALLVFPVETSAALAITVLLLSNGGFDLDGLMDTFDGLAVKSTGDRQRDVEKRLAVMKDSATGAVGVMALAVVLLLKYTLLVALLRSSAASTAFSVLFAMPVLGRWITVPAMYHARPARPDGLGRIFIGRMSGMEAATSAFLAALFCVVVFCVVSGMGSSVALVLVVASLAAAYLFVLSAVRFLDARFGGLTGDHCGALTEITEILFLMGVHIWLRQST